MVELVFIYHKLIKLYEEIIFIYEADESLIAFRATREML